MIEKTPAAALRRWFRQHGRLLPWRSDPSPYRVLVSEFMLQQTTVAAVLPRFEPWMQKFPDIRALAAAPLDAVLKEWEGLGYYSRARNLHRAAQAIATRHAAKIPSTLPELRALPGIGPYTASAIAAFAFDQPIPVLDANIIRVVARLFDYRKNITTAEARAFLEKSAASLLPEKNGRDHTSALMDIGATICKAGAPDCPRCPLRSFCRAADPASIPAKPPKKSITRLTEWRALSIAENQIHLIPSPGPHWKGLWILPPAEPDPKALASLNYSITRHRVALHLRRTTPDAAWTPFPLARLPAMPSPHRKILAIALEKMTPPPGAAAPP
jgi:A/G-specific adenine glycosylase